MRFSTVIMPAIFLAGCATSSTPPTPPAEPVVVERIVPVPCVGDIPQRPAIHTSAELLALDDYSFVTALHSDRLELDLYASKLEAVLLGCKTNQP